MGKAEVIQVIRTSLLRRGDGTKNSPIRIITQYWDFEGNLLWENDPHPEPFNDDSSQLNEILLLLDDLEKEGGDAPHRAVDPCTRIKVLTRGKGWKIGCCRS